jgi:hypothetical protein
MEAVSRPSRPDYAPGNQRALMFLGSSIPYNGQYTAQAFLVPGNPNGASGTPNWIFKAGSDKGWLSCTNCSQPRFTATQASAGCNVYDVILVTSYDGFESEPFFMFIDRPYSTFATNDPESLEYWKLTDRPFGNGWYTRFNYKTRGLCATGHVLSGYDMNEQFGSWQDDYFVATGTHNSWNPPDCAVNPQSYTCGFTVPGEGWFDEMGFQCPSSNCVPLPLHPGPDYTKVQSSIQTFRVGTGNPGGGVAIQIVTHQRYRDQGGHENIVNPANP